MLFDLCFDMLFRRRHVLFDMWLSSTDLLFDLCFDMLFRRRHVLRPICFFSTVDPSCFVDPPSIVDLKMVENQLIKQNLKEIEVIGQKMMNQKLQV